MARPEDKTVSTLRVLSEKRATCCNASITTYGGLYVGCNIICESDIVTGDLLVRGLLKIVNDLWIDGIINCPCIFQVNCDDLRMRKNLVPECDECLGTMENPWPKINAIEVCTGELNSTTVNAEIIDTDCLKTKELMMESFKSNSINGNTITSDSIKSKSLQSDTINTNHLTTKKLTVTELDIPQICLEKLNIGKPEPIDTICITNPESNEIVFKVDYTQIDANIPIYSKWISFQSMTIEYDPAAVIYLVASNIFLLIGENTELDLEYDASKVPDNTKIRFYFINKCQTVRAKYKLKLTYHGKIYLFSSLNKVKKIKLVFHNKNIYLIT
jgi:hypothetical protein